MRLFVAGPWGDFAGKPQYIIDANIERADRIGQWLVRLGHEVYIPHTMCRTWSGKFDIAQMERLDNSFLEYWAEGVYRLPGRSQGADAEVAKGKALGLPIFRGSMTYADSEARL